MNCYKFNDLHVGLKESFGSIIGVSKMDKFLDISNDCSPLHLDSEFARERGFDDRVVYGMLTASFYSTLIGVYLPGKFCILHELDAQFSRPVYIDDVLLISGRVASINKVHRQVTIKATILNQNDKKVSKATIKIGVLE
jgi:3-hydroxybutyryl-CoA dehydratase